MSISRLVSEEIEQAAKKDNYWEVAKKTALEQLKRPFNMGGSTALPDRESLHQR